MDRNCKFPAERKQLLSLFERDQKIRREGDFHISATTLTMNQVDRSNQEQLVKILEVITLPSVHNIGFDGAQTVWLIAQHAAYDLALMERVLALIRRSTRHNPNAGYYRGIPYLVDRINIMKGKPQIYGTQFWANPIGLPEPYPIADTQRLAERRQKFGLRSFREYEEDILKESERLQRTIYFFTY